jgi:NADH:ubiquinone oxidoreductase subunit 4 (subunit M)
MLWLYQRAFLGDASESVRHHIGDLTTRELAAIAPLVILMVWMGTATAGFLKPIGAVNAQIIEQSKVNVEYQVQSPAPLREARRAD